MLQEAGSDAEFKGLDVGSLITEHIEVNKAPEMQAQDLAELAVGSSRTWTLLGTLRGSWLDQQGSPLVQFLMPSGWITDFPENVG